MSKAVLTANNQLRSACCQWKTIQFRLTFTQGRKTAESKTAFGQNFDVVVGIYKVCMFFTYSCPFCEL